MFQTRPHSSITADVAASLAADFDAIARIENSLDVRPRMAERRSRTDFSRLARFVPNLKV